MQQKIDIFKTPVISLLTGNEDALDDLSRALQAQIDGAEAVQASRAALDAVEAAVARLKARHGALNQKAAALSAKLTSSRDDLRRALIDDAEFSEASLQQTGTARLEYDGVSEAIALLVTSVLPDAEDALLQAQIDHYDSQAKTIKHLLQERAERLVEHLTPIATAELLVELDVSRIPAFALLLNQHGRLIEQASRGRDALRDAQKRKDR